MIIKMTVIAEDSQVRNSVEYITVTGMELDTPPLLQMVDYGLRPEEKALKGTLVGKKLTIRVSTIRALFAGRPQLAGTIIPDK